MLFNRDNSEIDSRLFRRMKAAADKESQHNDAEHLADSRDALRQVFARFMSIFTIPTIPIFNAEL